MSIYEDAPATDNDQDEEEISFEANLLTITADEAAAIGELAADQDVVLEFEEI